MRHKLSQACRIIPPQMHAQVLSRFVWRIFSFHGAKKWATGSQNLTDKLIDSILGTGNLNDSDKTLILKNAQRLRDTKVNILITGATGCGKSSTINALFDSEKAKVGQGADPETMHIARYDLEISFFLIRRAWVMAKRPTGGMPKALQTNCRKQTALAIC